MDSPNKIKISELTELIRLVVRSVIAETITNEMSNAAAAGPTTTPVTTSAPKPDDEEEEKIQEGTDAATPGYNVPGAFARKGGSQAGIKGSESLGYTLTPTGKKDMERKADRLI